MLRLLCEEAIDSFEAYLSLQRTDGWVQEAKVVGEEGELKFRAIKITMLTSANLFC